MSIGSRCEAKSSAVRMAIANMPRDIFREIFARPFPIRICFPNVAGILHRRAIDRVKRFATAVSNTNGGTDCQPLSAKVTGVGGHSKAAKIFPWTRKAHSDARHVFLSLVTRGERFFDFLLQLSRVGDDRRKIIEGQTSPLT